MGHGSGKENRDLAGAPITCLVSHVPTGPRGHRHLLQPLAPPPLAGHPGQGAPAVGDHDFRWDWGAVPEPPNSLMEEPKPQKKAFSPVHRGGGVGGGRDTDQAGKPPQAAGALVGVRGGRPSRAPGPRQLCQLPGGSSKTPPSERPRPRDAHHSWLVRGLWATQPGAALMKARR